MKLDLNNPKLTAYALGELYGQEAKEMKDLIDNDKDAQAFVQDVKRTVELVERELGRPEAKPSKRRWFIAAILGSSAVAAAIAAVLAVGNGAKYSKLATLQLAEPTVQPEMAYAPSAIGQMQMARSQAPAKGKRMFYADAEKKWAGELEQDRLHNTETYSPIVENAFRKVSDEPLSTFSIDVDTASYANVRRFLVSSQLPPKDAVRIEELVNYFSYAYAQPKDGRPFSVHTELAASPWNPQRRLLRIGLKGRESAPELRPSANFVFLVDVSGSMDSPNRLPLVQRSLQLLVEQMRAKDRVALVVYAGSSGLVLPSTSGEHKSDISAAIDRLHAGGSTNGASGIELAYQVAQENFIKGGVNRVILATDGDFNVGVTNHGDLVSLIEKKAKSGVFLTVLGYGMGNYKDSTMQLLADKGNGNHAYIDSIREARKVLVQQAGGTLNTIAKDVKIQLEFNPAYVSAYRLIGYEKRLLNNADFNDDRKDAGEIGEGHTVTALYELAAPGENLGGSVDALKYQKPSSGAGAMNGEILTVKLRYKQPSGETSELIELPVRDERREFSGASGDMKFAVSVAGFGMILRGSDHRGDMTMSNVLELASANAGGDEYRREFVELVKKARSLGK